MIYKDDISNLREDIINKEGQQIKVKGALGRSRFFEKEATLEKAYPNLIFKYLMEKIIAQQCNQNQKNKRN